MFAAEDSSDDERATASATGVTTAVATGSSPGPVKTDQYSGDFLYNISVKDSLHLYYAWQQDARTEPNLQGNTIKTFQTDAATQDQAAGFKSDYSVSDRTWARLQSEQERRERFEAMSKATNASR